MPKFSLIVTFYNLEKYVHTCIDSILTQNCKDFELICVDDGSNDKTLQLLQNYAEKDSRILVISQNNQGVSVARNNGFAAACGEYVWFIDGDDYIEPTALEKIFYATENKPDIILIKYNFIKNKKISHQLEYKNIQFCKYISQYDCTFFEYIDDFIAEDIFVFAWNKIIRKQFINQNNVQFIDGCTHGEDSLFIYQLLQHNPSIHFINKSLYNQITDRQTSVTHIAHYNFVEKINSIKEIFKNLIYNKNELKILKLHDYMWDFILRLLLLKWQYCYFTDKQKYLKNFLDIKKGYIFSPQNYFYYKKLQQYQLLSYLKICWLYWKLLRPLGKHFAVLPYRKIKQILRGKNV